MKCRSSQGPTSLTTPHGHRVHPASRSVQSPLPKLRRSPHVRSLSATERQDPLEQYHLPSSQPMGRPTRRRHPARRLCLHVLARPRRLCLHLLARPRRPHPHQSSQLLRITRPAGRAADQPLPLHRIVRHLHPHAPQIAIDQTRSCHPLARAPPLASLPIDQAVPPPSAPLV